MRRIRAAIRAQSIGLPSTFWWLWAGMLVSALATFVFPFLAFFLTARGFTPMQAGIAVSLLGAGGAAAGPVGGHLADRVGRRPTALGALLATAGFAALLGWLTALPLVAGAVLGFGFASHLVQPALAATVADVVPAEHRPRAFGLLYWANNVGIGISLVVGGALASRSWLALFLADAATTLLFAAVVWRRVPETRPLLAGAAPGEREGYGAVVADRPFAAFLGLQLVFATILFQFMAAAPIDMSRHGLSPQAFGLVFLVNTALIATVQPWAARVTGRFHPSHVLAAATLLLASGYGAYALCSTAPQYALATAVLSVGEIAYVPVAAARVADLSPAHLRGRYQGAYSLVWGVAGFAAPALGTAVLGAMGAQALWAACLGVGVVAAGGQLVLGRAWRSSGAVELG